MAFTIFDRLWHQKLGRPYHLARVVDTGNGTPVVLLHGIGRTGGVWKHVVAQLAKQPYRIVAFDLLGFGASPKPDWITYSVDDHARSVIASVERLRSKDPVILVGHSMGCLIAVRVAHLCPELVQHLVLYEMPLYNGLPEKRRYRLRLEAYGRFYKRVMQFQPTFDSTAKLMERLGRRVIGFEVTPETWQPFIKSLEHTILNQTAAADIKTLAMPMDVIYGSYDMFVIRGKPQHIFGTDNDKITAHTIRARHVISPKASRFIVERITAAYEA